LSRRSDHRAPDQLRKISITRRFHTNTPGSVLIAAGETKILCTAAVTDSVPQWLIGSGHGWVTAEYSMLPGSTHHRKARESRIGRPDGRSMEIQRLIGRCLRAVIDVKHLPEVSVWVDCDVLSADGGTRTLSVTGGYLALYDALRDLKNRGRLSEWPLSAGIAATSVGLVAGEPLLDLCYEEDSRAQADMNVAMTSDGRIAEIQISGEKATISRSTFDDMLTLAETGCRELFGLQDQALEAD